MKIQEILQKVNSYHPKRVLIREQNNKNNYPIVEFDVNGYTITLFFKSKKKVFCNIHYSGHYFFSTINEPKLIFEYLHLILNHDASNNMYYISKTKELF